MAGETPVFTDGLSAFPLGINSGVAPLLLPKDQLSFAINSTVRGSYITHRPAYRKIALDFGDIAEAQTIFEDQGLWQGGCFFKSEYGTEAMVVSIGGHLFEVRPDNESSAVVTDVSIPTDLNNSGTAIAWLWQAERWMIVQNGQQNPLFYDGQTTRRSFGASQVLGQVDAGQDFLAPAQGASINITLAAPYTGPLNTVIYIDTDLYQVNAATAGFGVTLRNLTETPGATVNSGQSLQIPANLIGITNNNESVHFSGGSIVAQLQFSPPVTIHTVPGPNPAFMHRPDSGLNYISGLIANARLASGAFLTFIPVGTHLVTEIVVLFSAAPSNPSIPANTAVYEGYFNSVASAGTLQASFVIPAVGATVNALITTAYNGPLPQTVVINGGVYEITATNNAPPPSNTINVTNINDTLNDPHGPASASPGILHTVDEMQAGKMGAYGMGRNFYSLVDGRSYRATDLVGSDSGSPAVDNRDAVLRETENTFLTSGDFVIPGNIGDITSMTFTANLDTSLGQGPLQVGTPDTIFSCNAPIDATDWQSLNNPIQTVSLKGNGPLGQYSTINENSDTLFRSTIGLGSLILARREFATWGNTPISHEVDRIIVQDDTTLLRFSSAIGFQNRFFCTSKPIQSAAGVFHQGLIALDFEPVSSLGQKSPSVYDGLWTGINTLQVITGKFIGRRRAFAFSYNTAINKIELYEIMSDDEFITDNNGDGTESRITWQFETPMMFKDVSKKGQFDLCKLIDGEMYVADVSGRVTFEVFYRNQFDPCWHDWTTFSICATEDAQDVNVRRQNRTSLGLGKPNPANSCDPSNNLPFFVGENFQLKIRITGHCRFYGVMLKAAPEPRSYFVAPVCGNEDCRLVSCPPENDYGIYTLQDRFQPVVIVPVLNQQVVFCHTCPEDRPLRFIGTLPSWITFDSGEGCLVGSAGIFAGDTQEMANIAAQNALDVFGNNALASGDLTCTPAIVFVNTDTTGFVGDAVGFATTGGFIYGMSTVNLYRSINGLSWSVHDVHGINQPLDLVFQEGLFVLPSDAPDRMQSSPDGLTWTAVAVTNPLSVAYGNGIFVTVGGVNAYTSPDGLVWTPQVTGMAGANSVTFGLGLFVAVGQNTQIYSSPDGVTWTSRHSGASNLLAVQFSDGLFVAVGVAGIVRISLDGISWSTQGPLGSPFSLTGCGGGGGLHITGNSEGQAWSSSNGISWTLFRTEAGGRTLKQHGTFYYLPLNTIFVGFGA